jgi:hypothetical protein
VRALSVLDIVLAGVPVGEALYPRPCVVVEVISPQQAVLVPCSSQVDKFKEGVDLWLDEEDPDFCATGLKVGTYVIEEYPPLLVSASQIRRRYGRLEGELAERFKKWYGLE